MTNQKIKSNHYQDLAGSCGPNLKSKSPKLLIVGQGYVGLPLTIRAIEAGYNVVGFDIDEKRVSSLRSGQSYIDDISNGQIKAALKTGLFTPSKDEQDCINFDVAVITVPTPLKDGKPNVSFIEDASNLISKYLTTGSLVILESTSYPGTVESVVAPILETSGLTSGVDFHLAFSSERIDPVNKLWDIVNTPKVIGGVGNLSLKEAQKFWETIIDTTVPVSNPKVAEFSKLLENTFRYVNISLINELAMYANSLDIDIWEAIEAASTKPYGFMPFKPGAGAGGHCLPIDPHYLSWAIEQNGHNFRFANLASEINKEMPPHVVGRITKSLKKQELCISDSDILVIGNSYKANCGDNRESPAEEVTKLLVDTGANVNVHDPLVDKRYRNPDYNWVELNESQIQSADLVVVLVNHDCIDGQLITEYSNQVFDICHCLIGENVEYL
ncbi:MAG: nucleotide sugar dehydrogenase [Acidimicrobiia bacterium]